MNRDTAFSPSVALVVHSYYPRIGGCEHRVRLIARELKERGYRPLVIAPRDRNDPPVVDGIPVLDEPHALRACDVMFTYSTTPFTMNIARWAYRSQNRPAWMHYPCAVSSRGLDLIEKADKIIAFNRWDIELTRLVCGTQTKVVVVPPAADESRLKDGGSFRERSGITGSFILWAGAWSPAKGVRSLAERFGMLRRRHPHLELKLVMFGGRDDREYPPSSPDIICYDRNVDDLSSALKECVFLAFNSPAHPVGYDANPLILSECIMLGKTFVAQSGTPLLEEISSLGLVVHSDSEWVAAAAALLLDPARREKLEVACKQAYLQRYNTQRMMGGIERAIVDLLAKRNPIHAEVSQRTLD